MRKQKLSANITIGGVLEKSFKKNIGLIRSGFEKVGDSIKSVKARQKELTRQRADLVKQGRSVEALDREYEGLERTLEQLARKQRRWERAMRDSRRVGESFGKMSANIGRLSRRMALGVTAAGAGIFTLASSTASYGDQVAKTAGKLGIGIEALQEYRYAAERSGVSVETFDSSLTAMQKRLGEAAQGTGAAKKALEKLGLSAKDLVKLGPEEALAAISDKMRDIESPAERAALAAALFSRSGIGMVNMLGDGSKALQQLREDARRTGYVLSEEAARDAEAFADAQLDAQLVIKGLKNTIGRELMPVVTRSMKQFSAWAVANREDVAAFAETAATKIEATLPVIGKIIEGMATVSKEVGGVIAVVAKMVGGWENFGVIIGGVFAAKTIGSIVAFGASVARLGVSLIGLTGALPIVAGGIKAVGAVLLANPIGLAVAAIAGGAALIYMNWETVGPWFGKLWGGVKETFKGIGGFIGGVWRGDWDAAAEGAKTAWGGISTFYSTIWDAVGSVFKNTWENVIKPVTDALGVTDAITTAWAGVKKTFQGVGQYISGVWARDWGVAADGAKTAWVGITTYFSTIWDAVGAVFRSTWENAIKPVTDAMGATDTITSAWEGVKKTFQGIGQFIGGVWRGDWEAAANGAKTAWGGIATYFSTVWASVGSVFRSTWENVIKPVTDALGATDTITSTWEGVKKTFQGVGQYITGVWARDWGAAADGAKTAWGGIATYFSTIWDAVGSVFRSSWENAIKPVTDALGVTDSITSAWDGVKKTFQGVGEYITGVWARDWGAAADGAKTAWGGIATYFSTIWDAVGSVFRSTWENVIKPVTDALGVTDSITTAWDGVKTSLKVVLDWMGQKFDWLMGKLQPVLDGLIWLRDKGSGAVDGIKGIGSSIGGWFGGDEDAPETLPSRANPRSGKANPRHISGSFLGGDIGRGFRRVGENGPETIWNSKGAYVAHAGATERLSQMAEHAGRMMAALGGGLRKATGRAEAAAAPVLEQVQGSRMGAGQDGEPQPAAAAQPSQVVQHIQIVAAHLSVAQIAEEIERRGRAAQSGALFDAPHGYGQYGGA